MNNKKDFEALEKESRGIFEKAKKHELSAPPYLKTRILARLERNAAGRNPLFVWKTVAIASMLSLVMIISLMVMNRGDNGIFIASINQPILVKVDVKELSRVEADYAMIEIPENVSFYSQSDSNISRENAMYISMSDVDNDFLPFIITAKNKGQKELKVTFFKADKAVFTKKITITFTDNKGKEV